jgi:hypothetical protein
MYCIIVLNKVVQDKNFILEIFFIKYSGEHLQNTVLSDVTNFRRNINMKSRPK